MNIDLSALAPLAGTLVRAGLPALGTLLSVALPPPFDLIPGPLFKGIALALNIDAASPTAVQDVQAKVEADPAAAATQLQTLEQSHKDMADAANEELRLRLLDVQDARATQVQYVKAGSFMQAVPGIWTLVIVGSFIGALVMLLGRALNFSTEQVSLVNIMLGVLIGEVARCGNFWLGSSQSSRFRADQAIDFAHKATVAAQAPAKAAARR